MTRDIKYGASSAHLTETTSFGTHRNTDRPASALRNGASAMPITTRPRIVHQSQMTDHFGAPVRSFGDIALDPLRWCLASRLRMILSVAALAAVAHFIIA